MNQIKYEIKAGRLNIDSVDKMMQSVSDFSDKNYIRIQLLDASMVVGKNHISSALLHTVRAVQEKRMATQSIEMEFLLYVSGERQLTRAIPKLGIKQGDQAVAVVIFYENMSEQELIHIWKQFEVTYHFIIDESVLLPNIDKFRKWGFSKQRLKKLSDDSYEDLVLQEVAFVDIIK